jgi:trehalose 6-phosphate synthase
VAAQKTSCAASIGGLTVALADALANARGIWFGWSGKVGPATNRPDIRSANGVTIATLDLEAQDVAEYYNGFANTVLWPLFHHRIDLAQYERAFGDGYQRVNERFAEALCDLVRPDDLIWVHDYHLIPLGAALRRRGLANRIGFFLHIPWPARELLATLPQHEALVRSMFAYDLIGFQCEAWRSAFQAYVEAEVGGAVGPNGHLAAFGETIATGVHPIGIDAAAFTALAGSSAAERSFNRAAAAGVFRSMIISVDRVDYAKGLETRFLAIERLLQGRPDLIEKVFLLQVAQPSRQEVRAYADIHQRLDALSGRINGRFATVDWTPIRYLNHSYNRDHIAGLYRAARIGLVTPLRDGMNLVAKEFVAAQDPDDPGVLILSRFAGAASQMSSALIVNPYSFEDVADAIVKALDMPKAERVERWTSLMAGVVREDAASWRSGFLKALQSVPAQRRPAPLPRVAPLGPAVELG